MARLYACDRCRTQVEDTEEGRREWTHVSLAKVIAPLSPFQNADLCQDCTRGLREFLATVPYRENN